MSEVITIAEEPYSEALWAEAQPLLVAHWREIASYADIPLSPAKARYAAAAAAGVLLILTARTACELVGYAVYELSRPAHYDTSLQAKQDVIYVHPDHRRGTLGMRLLIRSEEILRKRGVQVVHQHQKNAHPVLGELLARRGYEPLETLWSKRLDR